MCFGGKEMVFLWLGAQRSWLKREIDSLKIWDSISYGRLRSLCCDLIGEMKGSDITEFSSYCNSLLPRQQQPQYLDTWPPNIRIFGSLKIRNKRMKDNFEQQLPSIWIRCAHQRKNRSATNQVRTSVCSRFYLVLMLQLHKQHICFQNLTEYGVFTICNK